MLETIQEIGKDIAGSASIRLLGAVISAIIVLVVGRILMRILRRSVGKLKIDPTLQKFLIAVVRVLIYFFAIMIVAAALGFEMSSLVALASVVSAAFALAASGMLSNIFGGLLLLITKPFGVDDYIITENVDGVVLEIGLLNTKVNTLDNKRVTIPNSTISSAVITNCSIEGKRRVDLVFKVGYENDPESVKTAIRATAENHDKVIEKENIFVRVSAYEDSSVAYTLRAWALTTDYWDVYYDLLEQVKRTFDQVGITMVFPHVDVRLEQSGAAV